MLDLVIIGAGPTGIELAGALPLPALGEDLNEVYLVSRNSDPRYKAARFEFEVSDGTMAAMRV